MKKHNINNKVHQATSNITIKMGKHPPQNESAAKPINSNRYKTELCRQYIENNECKYGDKVTK
jgi:hypothetical protein